MAVAVQASTKVTWSSGDGTLNKPTGTVDGDLILIFVGGDLGASENHTYTISGFTTLCTLTRSHATNAGCDLIVFWKIASSEPASWTVDIDSDNLTQAVALRIDGHDPADPFDITGITGYDNSTEAKIPSVDTTVANTLVIGGVTWDASKTLTAVPTDWTAVEHADTSGADLHVIKRAYAGTGATGVAQYDLSSASPHVGAAIAVQPPQSGSSASSSISSSVSPSPSASQSPSSSISPSPSLSVSASVSPSPSSSVSPSSSISPSPSVSVSLSVSLSPSPSPSVSISPSPSSSISPSSSVSLSESPSPSASQSPSSSISLSPSVSVSLSESPSPSISVSLSISPSPSVSVSSSFSLSPSLSISPSPSISVSLSQSLSPSVSESLSPSLSPSPSVAGTSQDIIFIVNRGRFAKRLTDKVYFEL